MQRALPEEAPPQPLVGHGPCPVTERRGHSSQLGMDIGGSLKAGLSASRHQAVVTLCTTDEKCWGGGSSHPSGGPAGVVNLLQRALARVLHLCCTQLHYPPNSTNHHFTPEGSEEDRKPSPGGKAQRPSDSHLPKSAPDSPRSSRAGRASWLPGHQLPPAQLPRAPHRTSITKKKD